MTNFNIGDKVQLYTVDGPNHFYHIKIAKILDCNDFGCEFEILEGTAPQSDYKVGDIIFISHSIELIMKKL